MTKLIAKAALVGCGFAVSLANYWFTFGLWPKSWTAFALCFLASIVLLGLHMSVDKE